MAEVSPTSEQGAPKKTKKKGKKEPRWVKAVTEYLPLAIFFLAFKFGSLTLAIQAIVVTTVIAVAISYLVVRRLPVLTMVGGGLVVAFGGASLLLGDDSLYKMKPTVLYTLMAIGLVVGLAFNRVFLKMLMEEAWQITDAGWRKLTWQYAALFVVLAGVNEVIWRTMSEDFWVNFKIFGTIGILIAFSVSRVPFVKRHALAPDEG